MRPVISRMRTTARNIGRRVAAHLAEVHAHNKANPDAGYTTETVVVTALLILAGIAALGVLAGKVLDKANSLNF